MFSEIYRKTEVRELPECGGTGTVYEHIKTGAKVFTVKSPDPNRVFMIGFRTIPSDSTGVAHIMEHSVLCGSEKFPLKDPFVELAKGSLNTFLNAMTYPDKTVYPVASCNEKDFMNLMDVYLDAVFHPNIYREKKIFLQEGWHYGMAEDGELSVNGVVYNEMKGAFSNPDSVLERYTLNALYPHTVYGVESGGDPDCIPELTEEAFLNFHRTFYHPSNAYIYLYGDLDMEAKLLWIDEQYLSAFDRSEVHSEISLEPAFEQPVHVEKPYAVTEEEGEGPRDYLSENFVLPPVLDSLTDLAWETIEFVLLSAPGAPLRERLLEKGIGEDVYGGYCAGIRQPYFSVIAKNASREQLPGFRKIIRETAEEIVRNGFDERSMKAALNFLEFKYREEDFGRTPAGLSYGLTAMEAWLYDMAPWQFLTWQEEFPKLREAVGTGWYEQLLKAALLENPSAAEVLVLPEAGMTERKDRELRERLSAVRASKTEEELRQLRETAEALEAWQEEEDSEEALAALPVLSLRDLVREPEHLFMKPAEGILWSALPTHGIAYMRLIYDISSLSIREMQLLSLLSGMLGELNTARHSFKELSDEILLRTGGIDFSTGSYSLTTGVGANLPFAAVFTAEIRTLGDRIRDGLQLAFEILEETDFAEADRVISKLLEAKAQMQARLDGASHQAAVMRAASCLEKAEQYADLTGGIGYSDFLAETAARVKEPEGRRAFLGELEQAARKLAALPFEAVLSGDEAACRSMREELLSLEKKNRTEDIALTAGPEGCVTVPPREKVSEAFRTGSMVNYVARSGRYLEAGGAYTGASEVLRMMLNYDYLWSALRVRGGAYGCMSGFTRSGRGYLVSYRDPNLSGTDRIYRELPEFLEKAEFTEEEILKYIIGAIAAFDQPVTASVKAFREIAYYHAGETEEGLNGRREEILHTRAEDLKAFAPRLRAMLEDGVLCTIGSSAAIEKDKALFDRVRDLY